MRGQEDEPAEHRPHGVREHAQHIREVLHDHPLLIDEHEDRWAWRRAIRRDPRKLFFYRIGVGVAGALLVVASVLTGPLPGPGGIPLFLLGLAVWASEFEWAQDLMLWCKGVLHRARRLPRPVRVLLWTLVVLCAVTGLYTTLLVYGPPNWLPTGAREWLSGLPGVR